MKITTANKISKWLSRQYGVVNPPEVIPLKYSRMGKSVILGYYNHDQNKIEINKYALELWKCQGIKEIIQHELIHALCHQEHGDVGHGPEFKEMCRKCGLSKEIAMAIKRD
jgi:predicted SprT family Zn-dependent metalloprotease